MAIKSKKILSEISAGELIDKISILEIKLEKIKNKKSQEEIRKEYKMLKEVQNSKIKMNKEPVSVDAQMCAMNSRTIRLSKTEPPRA